MKLAIVVGHNAISQGAVRQDTSETEFSWNSNLAKVMLKHAPDYGIKTHVFFRVPSGGYSKEITNVYREVDAWGADASIELHFNSASSSKATGTEMLTSGSAQSMRLAKALQAQVLATLNLRDRGTKIRTGKDRGGRSLVAGKAPAVLAEPFFGSSTLGLTATDEAHEVEALAHAYLRATAQAFGVQRPAKPALPKPKPAAQPVQRSTRPGLSDMIERLLDFLRGLT